MEQGKLFTKGRPRPGEVEAWCMEQGLSLVVGVDEAGRGPLAGPVVAAAVALDFARLDAPFIAALDDSKKLDGPRREALFEPITEGALATGMAVVEGEVIDEVNILQATFIAMHRAVEACCEGLATAPQLVMIDGKMVIPHSDRVQQAFVKGDGRSLHIAAASILAKVARDRIMTEYDRRWPEYGFASHKGYGTAAHRKAIATHGPCPIHRLSFGGVREHAARLRS